MRQTYTYPDELNLVSVLGESISKRSVQNLSNYYVSGTSGSDSSGNGMISNPWKTISKAITVLSAISGDITATINIAAGTYMESPYIMKSGITLIGSSSISSNNTIINGNVSFYMTENLLSFSIGGFQNIQLNGQLGHIQKNINKSSLYISDCLFVPPNNLPAINTSGTNGGILGYMTIRNCLIYMCNNVEAIRNNNNDIRMYNTQLTNNPSLQTGKKSFITVSGAGQINLSGCSITQDSSDINVEPLININNTATVNTGSTINNCMLVYTSAVNQGADKRCMNFSGTVDMNTYTIINNYFQCEGQPDNYCVYVNGSPQLKLLIGQNVAAGSVNGVSPSSSPYNKTLLSSVS